ncbi:PREDICTED: raf homolog serine/threonine-protein kinase phl [Nicrophorus vespilloides]|uniref:Raf homolog serine/threonine-protein kinase phl n=1 Tax=Nicrophorus vespilloides TaxID=110193 RepID=A0ABM1MC90_NICVS|nr:PREDICTED: raf homolog serine/threonine-protein kinase phl [Nicrophorus vespilloides]
MSNETDDYNIQQELRNIRSVITLTRNNIDALNAKFADFPNPPPMYVKEYEELTTKLHELESQEDFLRLHVSNGRESPESESDLRNESDEGTMRQNPQQTQRYKFIRAHLPNQQRTSVQVREGQSLKEALAKAMKLRNLFYKTCCAYLEDTDVQINWDIDISTLECDEITVKLMENFPVPTSISHNFVRKTFFSLVFCEVCHKLLFQGFLCRTCGYKFHQRCASRIPSLCHQVRVADAYYKALLASNYDMPQKHPGTLGQHDRSSSAPNVCMNSVRNANEECPHTLSLNTPPEDSQHSKSTQASPTSSQQPRRPRAKSADESKPLLAPRESIEDWEIPADEIKIGEMVGTGSFGTVYRGRWHGSVAVKTLKVKIPTLAQLEAFKNEVMVLRKTRHVNILLFMGCVSKPKLAIVTQWCDGNSLYRHLHVFESKFELFTLIEIGRQIAQGMDYLHAKNIIHRDLKSNNIFLHEDLTVKIGDFGLATAKKRYSDDTQMVRYPSGSILWMAPEITRMKDDNPYSFKSDVYAFGIVMFEMLTMQLPYSHMKDKTQILYLVGKGILKPDLTRLRSDTLKPLKLLVEKSIQFDQEERPEFCNIQSSLDLMLRSLPKIHRSASEPNMNRTQLQSDEFYYACASPKTPVNFGPSTNFQFYSSGTNI